MIIIKRKDLSGQKFGTLTVEKMLYGYNGGRRTYCECRCDCGNKKIICVERLKEPNVSCGCKSNYYRSLNNRTNEIGQKFGRLTIVDIDYSQRPSVAICLCDCGKQVRINKAEVINGHTQSCGCLQSEKASQSNTKNFSGIKSESGVTLVDRAFKRNGVWWWNCICPLCGNIFQALPAKVVENHTTSCGCKIQSSKERIIEHTLKNLGVLYVKEQRFEDCRYKYTLPFDFAVYTDDGKIRCLIEYDGEQHFRPIEFYGGESYFRDVQIRDNIKTQYCKNNNINLLRLNYTHTNKDIITQITNTIYA